MAKMKDRVALVTGGSRGIGAATAKVLASLEARVAVSGRTVTDLERVVKTISESGGQGLALECDVMNPDQVKRMIGQLVKKWGKIDILINNAGRGVPGIPVEEVSIEDWDRVIALNLRSAFLCVRETTPIMKQNGYGRIVNVSSLAGRNYGRLTGPQYGTSKAGLLGFTRHLAAELGPHGICVNAVTPSIVLTERVKTQIESLNEEDRQRLLSSIPLRRFAEPEDVATPIAFLASDDASYINGVCLDINGGTYMA